jgi:hypothetical protein
MSTAAVKPVELKKPNDLYKQIILVINEVLTPVSVEFIRLLPDGVVLGTAVLGMLSMCKSYGVLLLAMLELMLVQRLFSSVTGGISPIGSGQNANALACQPGFMFPNNMRISLLETIGSKSLFPSAPMFFISGILTYMIAAIQDFDNEIKALGGNLSTRTTVATVFSGLFLFIVFAFRHSSGCDSFGILLISIILGLIFGILIMQQNKLLFGRDGINLMNLPIIVSAAEMGKPMFVCGAT